MDLLLRTDSCIAFFLNIDFRSQLALRNLNVHLLFGRIFSIKILRVIINKRCLRILECKFVFLALRIWIFAFFLVWLAPQHILLNILLYNYFSSFLHRIRKIPKTLTRQFSRVILFLFFNSLTFLFLYNGFFSERHKVRFNGSIRCEVWILKAIVTFLSLLYMNLAGIVLICEFRLVFEEFSFLKILDNILARH